MKISYTFRLYDTTALLPDEWDTVANSNIFLKKEYLSVLEHASPQNMICFFIAFFSEEKLSGVAVAQFIDLSSIPSFGERDHHIKTKIRNFAFKKLSSKVLVLGNNMLTGQNSFVFSSALPPEKGIELLKYAADEITSVLKNKGIKTHLTILKDFDLGQIEHFKVPSYNSYYRFSTQPNMVFSIPEKWSMFENYIDALSKKYRDQYKRARKKAEGIVKRKMNLDEIELYQDRIYTLYLNVAKNAPFNTFFLPKDHFSSFKRFLGHHFLFYGYFIDDRLIGFNTLVKNGSIIDTYFLGYDDYVQKEKMLYLNMLYDMNAYSINKGYRSIVFARTALEIKSSVGATPIPMYGMIKHRNYIVNNFMSKLFAYFEPELQWKVRNPFK